MDRLDGELVAGFLSGRDACFAELVRRHQRALHWLLTEITSDAELAEDAVQETFMLAAQALRTLEHPGRFRNWLFRIGHHMACEQVRQARRGPPMLSLSAHPDLVPASNSGPSVRHEHPIHEHLERLLAAMDGEDRALLHLCHGDGYTCADIAEITGQTANAVRQRVFRLRQELANRLEESKGKTT